MDLLKRTAKWLDDNEIFQRERNCKARRVYTAFSKAIGKTGSYVTLFFNKRSSISTNERFSIQSFSKGFFNFYYNKNPEYVGISAGTQPAKSIKSYDIDVDHATHNY